MYRSKEERIAECKVIIEKLNSMNLTIMNQPIYELFQHFKEYVNDGSKQNIDIPFYVINKRIVGTLETNSNKQCILKLTDYDKI